MTYSMLIGGSVLPTSFEIDIWVDEDSTVTNSNNLAISMLREALC